MGFRLMQDEIRRRKFSFIEKLQEGQLSQAIFEKANEWDERMKKNRAERAKRREVRREARQERRETRRARRSGKAETETPKPETKEATKE